MDTKIILTLVGIFLGIMFQLIIPGLRKAAEFVRDNPGHQFTWNHSYTFTAILTLMVAIVATAMGFVQYTIPDNLPDIYVIMQSFVYGTGAQALLTEIAAWQGVYDTD